MCILLYFSVYLFAHEKFEFKCSLLCSPRFTIFGLLPYSIHKFRWLAINKLAHVQWRTEERKVCRIVFAPRQWRRCPFAFSNSLTVFRIPRPCPYIQYSHSPSQPYPYYILQFTIIIIISIHLLSSSPFLQSSSSSPCFRWSQFGVQSLDPSIGRQFRKNI